MIRVTHLITGLGVGGAERMLFRLLAATDRARFDHRVISLTGEGPMGRRIRAELGWPVQALGMAPGRPDPRVLPGLIRLLRASRPDLLQTWLYHADLLGLVAGRLARVPRIVWSLRCSTMQSGGWRLEAVKWLLARLSRWPDAVLANSQAGLEHHRGLGYAPRRWQVIPNGFDLDRLRRDPTARGRLLAELGLAEG
ncbi:MAG: glycosyltransferase, partial [Magnetococcales bacterium]|nr:glycosyltransferase [Magnetococcales bacterium]